MAILAAQSREEHLAERIISWFALRDRIELKMWGFKGEKAKPTFSQKYYIAVAGRLLDLPEEQNEAAFRSLKMIGLHGGGEVDRQQLQRLDQLHGSLSDNPNASSLVNKQVDLGDILSTRYDFSQDPMRDCVRAAVDLVDRPGSSLKNNGHLFDKPRWVQLAAASAAHAGYLSDKRARSILKGSAIEDEVLDAFNKALNASRLRTSSKP
jgi:hypothetical protein